MLNNQLFTLYHSRTPGLKALYAELDAKGLKNYVGPLLPYCWEEQYLQSRHRLVVIGQETNGWYGDYMTSDEEIRRNIGEYKDFQLGAEYNSLFWQYVHRFNLELNGVDDLNFVWLNVNKFGKDHDEDDESKAAVGKPDQSVLDAEVRHYNLLAEELAILKPDVCLFLTGPNYDGDIQRKLPDVAFHEFGGYGKREAVRLTSAHLPRHSYRTYHPGYGNRISDTYRAILRAILEDCKL